MNPFLRARWVADTLSDLILIQRRMQIGPDDLVLDVGSGGGPNPRANVLCDKFVSDGAERHGNVLISDRPLVVGDVERLPFADKAFDYVICAHLLEHVGDPAAAIAELQRVARRGYIETPSAEWEKLAGFSFHRWLVSHVDGRLVFQHKRAPIEDEALRDWFSEFQDRLRIRRRTWFRRRGLAVYTWLVWDGEIPFEVHGAAGADGEFVDATVDGFDAELAPPRLGRVGELINWWGQRSRARSSLPDQNALIALLQCPICGGSLQPVDHGLRCRAGGELYPLDRAGRPWLLRELADTAEH
jgi:SAM-dependent methyltransferase